MTAEPELVCPTCGERVPAHFANCWKCNGELSKAVAAPSGPKLRCTYCRGTDIETGITVAAGEPAVGLAFTGTSFLRDIRGGSLELLRADLCKDCGTVVRFSVEEVDRIWVKG